MLIGSCVFCFVLFDVIRNFSKHRACSSAPPWNSSHSQGDSYQVRSNQDAWRGEEVYLPKMQKQVCPLLFFFFFSSFILCTARISWLIPLCENVANISRTSNINSCMDVVRFLLLHYLLNYTHIPNSNLLCFTKPWFSFIVLFQPFL